MSNRDSLGHGEMVPQDVVDIFAQEKQGKASRKKRSRSLGRALGWLKGRKRKDQGAERQNAGLSPALDLAHPAGHKGGHHKSGKHANAHGNSHAVPKRDGDDDKTLAPPLFQENVFESSSRPKYLEDLHTEALEGLKLMQQEETSPGVDYQDNMSTISALSVQTDGEGGGFTTDSTMPDSSSVVSVQSSVSTKSSRSGLTRQGSTFRPLNSGKKSEKSRSRKRQRKTVAGIPQHVQRELGLDRVGWVMPPKLDEEQHYNGESDYSTTSDGTLPDSPDGPATSPESLNNVHPLSKEKVALLNASHAGLGDNLALLHHLDPSLHQELPSPVITMSPQAAYMSKIIPNAVLPPSIDVVEISRGRSRNSVRTVSKGSLVLSSPAPSRASSRASSKASTITSASRHNLPNMSDSNWSNSDSSETLVSDSSTISNRSTPSQRRSQNGDAHEDKVSLRSNGKINVKGVDPKRDGQFGRSLSVMKAKRAPPPPSRSYSLHSKMKRRSRDLAEVRVLPGELSLQSISAQGEEANEDKPGVVESPGYQADTSSLEDLTGPGTKKQAVLQENKLNMTSPSSGYSSQDVASPQPQKPSLSSSPKHKKGLLAKLQSLFPGSTPAAPAAASAAASGNPPPDTVDTVSPSVQALRELFNIPRHPKVHAPPPPPPEVWAHSKRSFELLLGPPAPDNVYAIIKKNPKDRRQQRQCPATAEGKQTAEPANGSLHVQEAKEIPESGVLMENNERLSPKVERKESGDEKVRGSDILNGMLAKAVEKRKERLAAKREDETKQASIQTTGVETSPPISLARISPSLSPNAGRRPAPPPVAVASPETSWPPPPPPLVQVSPPDELDFTLPPPPLFAEGASVLPVQVPVGDASQATAPPPLNIPPPPSYTAPPPPATASPLQTNKFHHSPKTNSLPVIQEAVAPPPAPPPPDTFSPGPRDPPTTLVTVVSRPVIDVSALPPETIPPPPPQSVNMTLPPQSIPPPPPLPPQASQLKITAPPLDSVLRPPESIPPPPPVERLHQAAAPPPAPETLPPPPMTTAVPPPGPGLVIKHQPTESPEKTPAPVAPEGSSTMVTPSLLQMVKLRSVNSSPEPPRAEVTMRKKLPTGNTPTSPPSGEAPQKPIRRSLIVTSPTSTSPPVIVIPQPPPPASQSVTVTSAPPSTVESSTELPPPATITASVVAPPAASTVTTVESAPAAAPAPPPVEAPSTTAITTDSSVEKSPPATTEVTSVVAPPASSTVVSVETPPPVPTAVEAQSTSTINSTEESPPATTAAPPVGEPPASSSPAVSSTEKSPPPTTVDVPVEVPPVPPPTVKSLEISPPAPTAAPAVSAPPASVSPVVSVETSPPVSAPPATASPVVSVETSPPVSAPPATASPVVSVETSPPVSAPPATASPVVSVETSPPVSAPPASASPVVSIETSPPASASPVISVETSPPVSAPPASTSPVVSVETSPPVPIAAPDAAPPSSTATSPMEKSPPTTTVVPPIVISPVSSTTVVSPVKKSPSATSAPPSMNLQEAIRLRTAARSKEAPASRLSLHSPTSPNDFRTSPTSTASFIFSKSNKKVVIETRPKSEVKGDAETGPQLSPVARAAGETQSLKKEVKVPPPVAKKPKSAGKEVEASEGTESAAEQEAQRETVRDAAEKANGTAGSVEGGGTPAS